jgi:hypothetical protein
MATATQRAEEADTSGAGEVSLGQKMMSAVSGSVLTSLLGKSTLQNRLPRFAHLGTRGARKLDTGPWIPSQGKPCIQYVLHTNLHSHTPRCRPRTITITRAHSEHLVGKTTRIQWRNAHPIPRSATQSRHIVMLQRSLLDEQQGTVLCSRADYGATKSCRHELCSG